MKNTILLVMVCLFGYLLGINNVGKDLYNSIQCNVNKTLGNQNFLDKASCKVDEIL